MPARDEQREEREPHEIGAAREPRDQPVRLHVVDGNDRDVVRRAHVLRGDDADAQAHGEAGTHGDGDGVEPRRAHAGVPERGRDDVVDGRLVRLLREVRDDASPRGVDGVLRRLGLAEDAPVAGDHRRAGVVARRLDAQDEGVRVDGDGAAVGSEAVGGERAGAEPGGAARETVYARASFRNPAGGEPSGGGIRSGAAGGGAVGIPDRRRTRGGQRRTHAARRRRHPRGGQSGPHRHTDSSHRGGRGATAGAPGGVPRPRRTGIHHDSHACFSSQSFTFVLYFVKSHRRTRYRSPTSGA